MKKLLAPIVLVLAAFLGFAMAYTPMALAADAATPANGSLLDLAKPIFDSVMAGHWLLGAALGLVLLVAVIRRYAAPHVPFLATDVGGALLTLFAGFGAAGATALTAGATVTWGLAWTALGVAVSAAGGYTLLNKLLVPLEAKAPAWMQPLFALVTWIFDHPDPVATATAAGDAAVVAKPTEGAKSVTGEITELK